MRAVIAFAAFSLLAGSALAEPTAVTVRALAKDAKFIGESMGGVEITLTDAKSGKVLAKGLTKGATGDTAKLVTAPRVRGQALSAPGNAGFDATLDLTVPTLVRAQAKGPMGKPDAAVTVVSEMWMLPGKALTGDGWIIEMPGLVVEPTLDTAAGVKITAKVTLMCGCPIAPDSTWDANHYEVKATLSQGGKAVRVAPLAYAGQTSTFAATLSDLPKGRYDMLLTAYNANTGNAGVAERPLEVR